MNVIIIDDDPLVCESLKTIITSHGSIKVLGIGHNGHEAIELFNSFKPDVVLMDIRMDEMDGLKACQNILKHCPDARILFLTTFLDDEYIVEAFRLGAKGYILKQDFEGIVPAIIAVHTGQSVFGDTVVTKLPQLFTINKNTNLSEFGINERELHLIELVAEGLNNKEIAETMHLGEGTVRNYLSVILEKLKLRDRTQLAVFYLNRKHTRT